ncbi:TonB-dependent receptor [Methylomicrobium sp. Wu6]|uniref:TonB-dependent receptor domain-containing protein n=1 Tax=Methylomicrobium sp. Wu6 TaxID=3107928 RepID=UPI002DD66DE0|nr:TonB-dependent receptor [Methylomicrobium sp. Wu6]MEC4747263.1 TonB-dependent receptor [Methylomicrobium sp. Wu6]
MSGRNKRKLGINQNRLLFLLALFLMPALVHAHTGSIVMNGWSNGFNHPLHGWDHLLTMLAVGIWAAQLSGRAVWQLPLAFVGVMSLGGLAGLMNIHVPGVEMMILLSVAVFGVLIVRRIRFRATVSLLIVVFFAFFHGYAHGQEMPASASLVSFALGFMLATLLLHGAGILTARLMVLMFAFFLGSSVHAQEKDNAMADANESAVEAKSKTRKKESIELDEIVVTERADSQIGIADSASQGNVGQAQLKYRPITRPAEVLETVPGLIATQHSGEGKANQYFLRGFNLDHGTDFLTQIEGVPVNQLSHSHGQGWTDTNFLIPELIETLKYKKGNYYAENGDFSSTGSANIHYLKDLPQHLLKFTGGSFDYYRGLAAGSQKLGGGHLLYAGETVHNNGPWTVGNDYLKFNGLLRYSQEHADRGWSLTGMATHSDWRSTDQIAKRAVDRGTIGRFDALDPTDGGNSQRYSFTGEWHRQDDRSETKLMAYGIYSTLNLFSNFTFFLDDNESNNPKGCSGLPSTPGEKFDPVIFNTCGDQFGQPDDRWTTGFKGSHTLFHKLGAADSETTFGLQLRNDNIQNGLTRTHAQRQYAVTRQDTLWVTSISPYMENKTQWNHWLRTSAGVRFDGIRFDVSQSNIRQNTGERYDGLVSPKLGIIFGPWAETEFYLNGGLGYHSNDARGINTRIDPTSGIAVDRASPLVRTYGAEIGARSTWVKGLQSTLSLWWLDIDSELLFVGDAGTTEASRPSRRYGLEFANYYSPADWITFDADVSASHARFRNTEPGIGNHIPNSIETVIAAGTTFHDVYGGFFGGPRLRYFGPRALDESGDRRSGATLLVSAMLGYEVTKNLSFQAEVFNLLNRKDDGITYFYTSRLPGERNAGVDDFYFHPVEPLSFRLGFTAKF